MFSSTVKTDGRDEGGMAFKCRVASYLTFMSYLLAPLVNVDRIQQATAGTNSGVG